MLLLVTIGLVVVGAVALVIGFVSNSLGPIYISIACSVIAGVVLVVFSRMARRGDAGGSASAVPASTSPGSWSPAPATPPAPVAASPTATFQPSPAPPPVPAASPPPPPSLRPREPEPTITMDEPVLADDDFDAPVPAAAMLDGDDFPIANYDTLRASQIVDQLAGLDLDELDMVQEREEQTKNRATVLRKVVLRIDELEAEDAGGAPMAAEPAAVEDFPAATEDDFPAAADDEFPAEDDGFPIADYDQLSADEIIAVLDDLEDEELDMVAEREELGQNRVEILNYIDDMFEEIDGGEPEPARPAPRPAPAPRAAAKKAPAKKAPARKAAAKKAATAGRRAVATPVAKAPARKVPAGKAAAKAAPARATAKRAAASPGTKTAGRRATAPSKVTAVVSKDATAVGRVTTRGTAKKAAAKKVAAKRAAATTRKR